jgi:hypothetical protein
MHYILTSFHSLYTQIYIYIYIYIYTSITEKFWLHVTLQTYIRKALGLKLRRITGYPDWWFSSVSLGNACDNALFRPPPLSSKSFPIHRSSYHPAVCGVDAEVSVNNPHKHIYTRGTALYIILLSLFFTDSAREAILHSWPRSRLTCKYSFLDTA